METGRSPGIGGVQTLPSRFTKIGPHCCPKTFSQSESFPTRAGSLLDGSRGKADHCHNVPLLFTPIKAAPIETTVFQSLSEPIWRGFGLASSQRVGLWDF